MNINDSWKQFIENSKYYGEMLDFISKEKDIAPTKDKVFRFFNCDLNKCKEIVLGMDPYPSTYVKDGKILPVATGRSFEVENVEKWTDKYKQKSLMMMFKAFCYQKYEKDLPIQELRKLINEENFKYINIHDWFDKKEKEGTIFLNATLTTKINSSNSHYKIWEKFMNELISYIVSINPNIKWHIWGEEAYNRIKELVPIDMIYKTCHPASRVNNNFVKECKLRY